MIVSRFYTSKNEFKMVVRTNKSEKMSAKTNTKSYAIQILMAPNIYIKQKLYYMLDMDV